MRWVLLRGLAREAGHWAGFAELLARRSGEPVLCLDLPGNGTEHARRSPASVAAMAQDGLRRLPPGEPALLVALSLGGMAALECCRLAPDRLAGCALVNSSVGRDPPWRRLRPANYGRLLRLLLAGEPAARERAVLAMTSARPRERADVLRGWERIAQARPVSRANALRQLWSAARYRGPGEAPAVPLLLLASEGDGLVSARCSQALAARWNVPLHLHPWAGHDLALDDPGWLAERLCDWRVALR